MKAGPAWAESGLFRSGDDALADAEYVADRLAKYALSHWLLMGAMADLSGTSLRGLEGDDMFAHFRPRFGGTLMANVGVTPAQGNQLIADGTVDLVAFGQAFIANPDLPERLAADAPLATPDHATFYSPGPHGYTDYPAYVSLLPCRH